MTDENEPCKKEVKISLDVDHSKCSICLNIWHDVVTVAPCLHNFCNGCFSEWLRRCQEKHTSVLCPQCRAVVQFVGRNHFLHSIEEDILQNDILLKRPDDEIALLDSYATIKSPLAKTKSISGLSWYAEVMEVHQAMKQVLGSGRKSGRKRLHLSSDEEHDLADLPCRQCGTEIVGFRCNPNTIHLQCHSCGGMMPSRTDLSVPQQCLGCDRAFCGVYWHALGDSENTSYPVCGRETFRTISERTVTSIPLSAHENNRHEQDITERCIRQTGRTVQDVITEWIAKFNNGLIDRSRMPLNHAEMITVSTHICNECYDKFVSFLLYWFRVTLPKSLLPADSSQRQDCWYGYTCRTQRHNADHAVKRNHVCRPTRGRNM